ncbi:MAG: DUF1573 domain-containing protein [Paraprevotella sp.]|nr:DUF1573 domain-containing protein [Paraprevotella sp.]
MKKLFLIVLMCVCGISIASAQKNNDVAKQAEIKFDTLTHNFGTFSEDEPLVKCTFNFTNVGTAPLIIHQAIASCGCTVPTYTRTPIKPGEQGTLDITYNGHGKFPGRFKKAITVRCNGRLEMVRLYVEGNMEASKKPKEKKTDAK